MKESALTFIALAPTAQEKLPHTQQVGFSFWTVMAKPVAEAVNTISKPIAWNQLI